MESSNTQMRVKFVTFLVSQMLLVSQSVQAEGEDNRTDLYLLGLFPINTHSWAGGESALPAAELAIKHINERPDILPGYKLTLLWGDSKCDSGEAVDAIYKLLYQEPTKIMVLGPGCSHACQSTASAIRHWELVQMSFGCALPSLSDKTVYPRFSRLRPPDTAQNAARIAILQEFGWNKVAIIYEPVDLFSETVTAMATTMEEKGMTVVSLEPVHDDAKLPLEKIKSDGIRIVVGFFYTPMAVAVFCEAHKLGLFGPKYGWLMQGWYDDTWIADTWTEGMVDCTQEELAEFVDGAFSAFTFDIHPLKDVAGISGMTPNEYLVAFDEFVNYTSESLFAVQLSPVAYDTVWALSLALNYTLTALDAAGGNKRLENYTYGDTEMADMIMESISRVAFDGMFGTIQFDEDGEVLTDFKLQQYQGGVNMNIGMFRTDLQKAEFYPDVPVIWKGDGPPIAELTKNYVIQKVPAYLHGTMSTLAIIGIICSVIFLSLNIKFRRERIIKMSSPNINNIILCGCILTYSSILSANTEESNISLETCWKLSTYILLIGFSTAYGAIFSKTWRVHIIFTNVKLHKKVVRDRQLLILVLVFIGIDVITIAFWEILDPVRVVVTDLNQLPEEIGDKIYISQIELFQSSYMSYWVGIIYSTKALMLLFGVFLAWETRKVSIKVLNDSRHIGMCIYNVVILSTVGVPVLYVLHSQPDIAYAMKSVFVILGATVTQCLVILPKIMAYRAGEDIAMGVNSIRPGMTQMETTQWQLRVDDSMAAGPSRVKTGRDVSVSVGVQVQL